MQPDHGDIWTAVEGLHETVSGIGSDVQKLAGTIGKPGAPDGGEPPTGIFAHLNGHHLRLKRFERLYENAKGALIVGAPLLTALWWLGGDKISKFFHG